MIKSDYLVYQAKSFYNAHIALEQISQQCETPLLYSVPTIVNGAFSIELALKAILAKNHIDYGKEHNLMVLFKMLPTLFQEQLVSKLLDRAPAYADAKKLKEEFVLISNAFVDWRYCFEDNPVPAFDIHFLYAFAAAAIYTMYRHYNVDYVRRYEEKPSDEDDERIDEEIRKNREQCIEKNLRIIEKRGKEHQL